ncbi:MAG TPA: hypothetical protein VK699_05095 [Terriglobales bacterium]|jgi:hypothetical protein|nr:hypothetical protein [Terriglobales bacterium]
MDEKNALHTTARRFCQERHSHWAKKYNELGSAMDSQEGLRLFPRYRLDEAMLVEIERLVPSEFTSLQHARASLAVAAEQACNALLTEFKGNGPETVAIKEELSAFHQYINQFGEAELKTITALPYRRVLTQIESEKFWKTLQARWDIGREHCWYPLSETSRPEQVIAFHRELWNARDADTLLRRFLTERKIERCILFREVPPDYEIASSLAPRHYDGDESFLTSDFEWVLYVSHESSVTVAGTLAEFFRNAWPDSAQVTYGGPFHTEDLRGTWKW